MTIQVTRTYVGPIQNRQQVCDGFDSLGDSASKIQNVARRIVDRVWDEAGKIPNEGLLKSYMKNQVYWEDLNAQSSQKVTEEFSDVFQSWFDLRHKDSKLNPPGYRRHGDKRPRSTVTFKADGFEYDPKNNRVRLSKGSNLKGHFSDFILCEYQTRPDADLSEVESVQNARAARNGDEWELHFVYKASLETNDSAGDKVAGIGLGIKDIAMVAFSDEYVLYPDNSSKQDKYYFTRIEYDTKGENGPSEGLMQACRKLVERGTHFYHTLMNTIITECAERGVGTFVVSWPEDVRDSDWGKTGNKKLHTWVLDRIYQYLKYKGKIRGVEMLKENEWDISRTCSRCGDDTKRNWKHRGLYVCSLCGLVGNADCNGAENMRQKITPSPHGEDRSNGCAAQPSVHLFDSGSGCFAP